MTNFKPIYSYLFFIFFSLCLLSCSNEHDEKYAELDDAVAHRSEYMANKEKSILMLKEQIKPGITLDTKYQIYNQIFNEYLAYKADSASKYVGILNKVASEIGNKEYENEAALNNAALLATSGLFDRSEKILKSLNKSTFTKANYRLYYENCRWLYITWCSFLSGEEGKKLESYMAAYNDSMITVVPRNDVDYYYWMGEYYRSHHEYEKAKQQYEIGIERMSPLSRRYASITCSMAFIGRDLKQWDFFEKYMILSATADQKIPLKENMAMQELAEFLTLHCNDMKRANNYLLHSLEDAIFYNNRLRLMEIARKFPDVVVKYQEKEQKVQNTQIMLIILFVVIAVLLLAFAWYGHRVNKDLRAQRKIRIKLNSDLTAMNDSLNSLNNDLKTANETLKENNILREKYVSLFLELCAAYIDKYNHFHKTIERKVKAHQVDDLLTLLHQSRTKDTDTREFFMNFDKAFLALYPDFVAELNKLLLPDQQVSLKGDELLSNELRIMALIRLGVTDTQKIATLLFYSTQTVYNYRSSFKSRAIDKTHFEENLMAI